MNESVMRLQSWISRISDEDRDKLANALRLDSTPREVLEVMAYLRAKYDFVPADPAERSDG